jgi:hypothetical protein
MRIKPVVAIILLFLSLLLACCCLLLVSVPFRQLRLTLAPVIKTMKVSPFIPTTPLDEIHASATAAAKAAELGAATSAPFASPTSVPTTNPTTAITPGVEQTPEPTLEPALEPMPGAELYAVVGIAPDDVLNLREGAGVNYPVVAGLPPGGTDVQISGPEQAADNAVWVPATYQDKTGWLNKAYLARQYGQPQPEVAALAAQAIQALDRQDYAALSDMTHSEGLRFSPYAYVQADDQLFTPDQVRDLASNTQVYHWGVYDGSGEPMDLSYSDYYKRFIFDVDFARPQQIGFNYDLSTGNHIVNYSEFYPGSQVVEYYFPGFDPQYGGMDWRSLRLVFLPEQETYKLAGIIHDEWGP